MITCPVYYIRFISQIILSCVHNSVSFLIDVTTGTTNYYYELKKELVGSGISSSLGHVRLIYESLEVEHR